MFLPLIIMEQQIISVLYVKPFRFFNVLQIRYILEKEQIELFEVFKELIFYMFYQKQNEPSFFEDSCF